LDRAHEILDKRFDVIFASHVIEHIAAPTDFSRQYGGLLREGGLLVFVTPNIRSVLANLSGRRWVSYKVPEHVAYYSPQTIREMFTRSGLETVAIESAYEYHNLEFLAQRVRKLIRPMDRFIPAIERLPAFRDTVFRITSGSMRVFARPV